MNIKKESINDYLVNVSGIFIVLLFPGFSFYHTAVAFGIIPPVFGGFFGFFSVFYILLISPFFLNFSRFIDKETKNYFYLLVCFFTYMFLYSSVNYLLSSSLEVYFAYVQFLEFIVLALVMFFIGYFVQLNQTLYNVLFCLLLFSSALLLYYVLSTGQVMFYAKVLAIDSTSDSISTYQEFGRSALIASLILLSMTKQVGRYLFVYLVSIFVLFILGARSEFVGLCFSGFLVFLIKFRLSLLRVLQLSSIIILGAIFISQVYEKLLGGRSIQLFNMSKDVSWQGRKSLEQLGLNHIEENPILGYFAGYIIDGGATGAYVHSILSVWASFGLLPFVLYTLLCFIPLLYCIQFALKNKNQSDKFYLCLSLSLVIILLILFSKSIFWLIPSLAWGVYFSVKKEQSN